MPRRGGGREPCHSPKYFGQPYSSLPHRLRAEPPRRGGQGVSAPFLTICGRFVRPREHIECSPTDSVRHPPSPCVGADSISARRVLRLRKIARAHKAPLQSTFSTVCQKTIFPVVETVGANIVRPPTWRSNVFSGRFLTRQTGTGEHCSPLQSTFSTIKQHQPSRERDGWCCLYFSGWFHQQR